MVPYVGLPVATRTKGFYRRYPRPAKFSRPRRAVPAKFRPQAKREMAGRIHFRLSRAAGEGKQPPINLKAPARTRSTAKTDASSFPSGLISLDPDHGSSRLWFQNGTLVRVPNLEQQTRKKIKLIRELFVAPPLSWPRPDPDPSIAPSSQADQRFGLLFKRTQRFAQIKPLRQNGMR